MYSKWLYGTLFVLLAMLGVKMDSLMVSNQEIVVQFAEEGFTQDKAQQAIADAKDQLQEVGVANIQIRELEDGGLKITYYSDLAASEIQQILSEADLCTQHPFDSPIDNSDKESGEDYVAYELNVYEIQSSSQTDLEIEGTHAPENQIKEHLYVSYGSGVTPVTDLSDGYEGIESSLKFGSRSAAFRTLPFYTLPEVRAGPLA